MLVSRSLVRVILLIGLSSSAAACNRTGAAAVSVEPGKPDAALDKARPRGTPQPRLPVGKLEIDFGDGARAPIKLQVEVASKPDERQQGLMFREHLPEGEGMLFVFATERHNSFWMHNTLIPLDMLFIDGEWTVVGIVENATPLTDDPRGVPQMSQYVLELPAGFSARNKLRTGLKINFVPPESLEMP